jgi:nucleoside-diphosphate-sugar epimerase
MSRVIVTGGAGRLGRSVVTALAAAGHEVLSLDRDTVPGLPARQLAFELLDPVATRELFVMERPDAVIHLAAISVPFSLPDPEIFATNTGLAMAVLEASLAGGAGALLLASSPTVIGYGAPAGWQPDYLPLDERHPIAPWNGYALSKAAIEHLVRMVAETEGSRLKIGAFRPCSVIAPEEWQGAPTQQGHTVLERLDEPALSAVALFNYLDARDAGDFVERWLARVDELPNGSIFFVSAADSLVREPVAEATARLLPEVAAAAAGLAPTAPIFSGALAEQLLGWRPRRSWRTELPVSVTSGEPDGD